MAEFTGERVIPGEVDLDLWNEHQARYAFAARLARGKRVADLGCGAGYGSAELAVLADSVSAVDVSPDAIKYATAHYDQPNLHFAVADATSTGLPDASQDLVVAFELIEHLGEPQALIAEARRLLAPTGQFIVSTPNREYYREARAQAGPNPFHQHEFSYSEFRQALEAVFPHVSFFAENHTSSIVFEPLPRAAGAEVRVQAAQIDPEQSHFFLAVCALRPQTGSPVFVYVPSSANVLREREHHIHLLEEEVAQKTRWLEEGKDDRERHAELVEMFRKQTLELEERNQWAGKVSSQLKEALERVAAVQEELAAEQLQGRETAARYDAKITELERESGERLAWGRQTEQRLMAEVVAARAELARCVELLDRAEQTVEERTRWAQSLEAQRHELEAALAGVRASRWVKLGRRFGIGPEIAAG